MLASAGREARPKGGAGFGERCIRCAGGAGNGALEKVGAALESARMDGWMGVLAHASRGLN